MLSLVRAEWSPLVVTIEPAAPLLTGQLGPAEDTVPLLKQGLKKRFQKSSKKEEERLKKKLLTGQLGSTGDTVPLLKQGLKKRSQKKFPKNEERKTNEKVAPLLSSQLGPAEDTVPLLKQGLKKSFQKKKKKKLMKKWRLY